MSHFICTRKPWKKGYYVKDAKGNDYDGWCWPGSSSYPDTLNPDIGSWWADKFSFQNYVGSTPSLYIWNDMNKTSVFNGPEVTMPRDCLHYGGVEHRELHNVLMLGAFFGNPETELLVRWYRGGAFYPFFRAHAHHDTKRQEPWLFGEANLAGTPLLRPLWMEFPSDEATFSNDETFMVGNSPLVQGIYAELAKHVSVHLPGKQPWYNLRTGTVYKGGLTHKLKPTEESIPAFLRAGTIVPRKDRFRRSSTHDK